MPDLGDECENAVMGACKWRNEYLGAQAARWIILTEQGKLEEARAIDDEVHLVAPPLLEKDVWMETRFLARASIRSLRDGSALGSTAGCWAKRKLECYIDDERRWMVTTELERAQAAFYERGYISWIKEIYKIETRNISARADQIPIWHNVTAELIQLGLLSRKLWSDPDVAKDHGEPKM